MSLRKGGKHPGETIDRACAAALDTGEFTLGYIRRWLERAGAGAEPARQAQLGLDLLEEHPIIRPLSHYQQLLGPEEFFNTH